MRGAPPQSRSASHARRIIPADAGSTNGKSSRTVRFGDHPRGCGEHVEAAACTERSSGSSPRMRGAQDRAQVSGGPVRIIPADAGSTAARSPGPPASADHPRGCGEHHGRFHADIWGTGSSPRMRGAHVFVELLSACDGIIPADAGSTVVVSDDMRRYGIIPADAGSTSRASLVVLAGGDHPRGCGEHPF